jgi:3-deoxy-D-manno-octulosonate 8-phosphate phosphatase (KDO 8-P phosphatase)
MTLEAPAELAARCQSIELLVTDVDGVLTDGAVVLDDRGIETKQFHVRDGLAFSLWHRAGKQAAILSGRTSAAVGRRARELGIGRVFQGHDEKVIPFRLLIDQLGLAEGQVCYVGDDLPDLPVLRSAGLAVCPADAAFEVKEAAHFVSGVPGGRGVIREIVELILKSQGKWNELICDAFSAPSGQVSDR